MGQNLQFLLDQGLKKYKSVDIRNFIVIVQLAVFTAKNAQKLRRT